MVTKKNTKKKVNKKNTKGKAKSTAKKFDFGDLSIETISIVLICISILLFFSVYIFSDFLLTSFLKFILIFLFGLMAYVIPIILIVISSYMFVTKNSLGLKKNILCTILILVISSFIHVVTNTGIETLLPDFTTFTMTNPNFTMKLGGLMGAIFGGVLLSLVGKFLSGLFLFIGALFLITQLFNRNFDDFKFISDKFVALFLALKHKIENSLKFDEKSKEIDNYTETEIIFADDDNRKSSKLSNNDEVIITEKTDTLTKIEKPDFSKGFGIERKRDTNKVPEDNNLFRNMVQKKEQKPTIQVNKRKMNPFSKKPKIKIYDFTSTDEQSTRKPNSRLENTSSRQENISRTQAEENHFVNVRKGTQQPYSHPSNDQPSEPNYDNSYESISFYEDNTTNQSLDANKIDHYERTIKALKTELDRQMFLFQDAQQVFSEQKSVEKNLLKIINAQRETIEKQSAELKAYKMSMQIQNTSVMQENNLEPNPADIVQHNQVENYSSNIDSIFDNIATNLEHIDIPDYSPTAEYNTPDYEPVESAYIPYDSENEYYSEQPTNSDDKYVSVSFDEDFDDATDFDDTFTNEHSEIDYANDYDFGIPDYTSEYTSIDTSNILAEISDTLSNESLQNITKGLVSESYSNTPSFSTTQNITRGLVNDSFSSTQNIPSSYTPITTPPSIFRDENAPRYNTPIKPNFDAPIQEEYIYKYPTVDFLNQKPVTPREQSSKQELISNSKKLEATLKSFGVVAKVMEVSKGPSVTRYEVQPGLGVKVSKIANLSDDLALNLAAKSIRIQAPIPGKAAVGIEVPNETTEMVPLREVLDDENFKNFKSKLAFGIGKDISGKIVVADLATMPHLLIAGATGSGKSVCVNTLITSIVYKSSPKEVKLLMIDPKVVELSVYNGIPHLLIPVVTDPKKASAALNWAVREMEKRYKLFSDKNVRDLKGYNAAMEKEDGPLEPQIVIIIDELADLMMTASKEVEAAIIRIAQMARAAGIHLIIATQRPTADVITGLIKSNIPSRLAFSVSSGLDSKIILDETGAEKLLGKGDMLFKPMGAPEPFRIQGAFISDKEVESIVTFLKKDAELEHNQEIIEEITSAANPRSNSNEPADTVDDIFEEVVEFIISQQKASTSLIQRRFRVGFNRAARIVDELENFGIIGPDEGNKPRKVLMTMSEWDNKFRT